MTAWVNYAAAVRRAAAAHTAVVQASRRLGQAPKSTTTKKTTKEQVAPADDGGIVGGIARGVWNATGGFVQNLVSDPGGTIGGMVEPFAYVATHLSQAPADFIAGVDYLRSQPESTRAEFLTSIATGVVVSRKLTSLVPKTTAGARTLPAGVSDDWVLRVADSGKGRVWQAPGATGDANSLRMMDPTPEYPNGYVRFYNDYGQPIGLDGKPGPNAMTHIPINPDGTFPTPTGW